MPVSTRSELAYIFAPSLVSTIITPSYYQSFASLKTVSLPWLELPAALLLARLINKIRESLELSQCPTYLWSNSTIALNWIISRSRWWSVFVANRVGEIQRLTEIKHSSCCILRQLYRYIVAKAKSLRLDQCWEMVEWPRISKMRLEPLAAQCLWQWSSWTKENPHSRFHFSSLHHWRITKQVFQFKQNMPHHSVLFKII